MRSEITGGRIRRIAVCSKNGLAAFILAGIGMGIGVTQVQADENELDFDFLGFVGESVVAQGFVCSSAAMGHTLYEDEVVAVLEVSCSGGESYEVIDVPVVEDLIVVPLEDAGRDPYLETMDSYLLRNA